MSQQSDQDVVIRIVTAFEKGGIEEAKKVAAELQQQMDGNSDAGKTLSGMMKILDGDAGNAANVFKGLSSALKGGTGAVNGLASAVKGLGPILGVPLGPLNLLVASVQAVVTGIQAWKNHSEKAAEATKKAAEEAEAAAKQAAEALEKDMAAAADAVTSKFKAITDELKASVDQAEKLSDATAALGDAQHELELARLDAKLVGVTDEDEKAKIKQEKTRLKAGWERQKLFDDSAAKRGELANMDYLEDKAKEEAASANWDLTQAEHRWTDEQAAAESRLSAAQVALETAQGNQAASHRDPSAAYNPAEAQKLAIAAHQAQQEVEAAEAALTETTGRIARERAVLEAAADKANQQYDNLVATHAPQRQIIQKQIDTNTIKGQIIETNLFASEHQYDLDSQARQKAADEAKKEKARDEVVERDKNMSVDNRIARAQGLVRQEQRVGEKLYGGEPGIETQRLAQTAIAEAGRQIAAGQDDAQVITQLIATLRNLGAVLQSGGLGRLVTELDKMDGEIDQIRSQLAHLR